MTPNDQVLATPVYALLFIPEPAARSARARSFAMIGALTMVVSFFVGLGVWFFGIRRYLSRHGGTVITGATWWVSAWSDWQQCGDFARAKQDSKASILAKVFLLSEITFVVGIVIVLCGK